MQGGFEVEQNAGKSIRCRRVTTLSAGVHPSGTSDASFPAPSYLGLALYDVFIYEQDAAVCLSPNAQTSIQVKMSERQREQHAPPSRQLPVLKVDHVVLDFQCPGWSVFPSRENVCLKEVEALNESGLQTSKAVAVLSHWCVQALKRVSHPLGHLLFLSGRRCLPFTRKSPPGRPELRRCSSYTIRVSKARS